MKTTFKVITGSAILLVLLVGVYTIYFNIAGPGLACDKQYVSEAISPDQSLRLVQIRMPCSDGTVSHSIGIEYLKADAFSTKGTSRQILKEQAVEGGSSVTPKLKIVWLDDKENLVQHTKQIPDRDSFEMGGVKFIFEPISEYAP